MFKSNSESIKFEAKGANPSKSFDSEPETFNSHNWRKNSNEFHKYNSGRNVYFKNPKFSSGGMNPNSK